MKQAPPAPEQMPPPAAPPKSPLTAFFTEIARQAAPEYHGLAELLVNFREKPDRADLSKALFHSKKLYSLLKEAERQLAAARSSRST